MSSICIPFAEGVPFAPGPPIWWNRSVGEIPYYNDRLDDPRWRGAASRTYPDGGNGTGETALFRALYHEVPGGGSPVNPPKRSLYLSWYVEVDPKLDFAFDRLLVGFYDKVKGTSLVIEVDPIVSTPATESAAPLGSTPVYSYNGSKWEAITDTPDWISGVLVQDPTAPEDPTKKVLGPGGRKWVTTGPARWAVNLQVPLIASGTVTDEGINLSDDFVMWYEIQVEIPGSNNAFYSLPRGGLVPAQGPEDFPKPHEVAKWNEFHIGSQGSDCGKGVSIGYGDLSTDNTPFSEIQYETDPAKTPKINVFHARPHNSGPLVPAQHLHARFRMANWGSKTNWNEAAPGVTLWNDIRGGGDVANATDITTAGDLSFPWTLNPDEIKEFVDGKRRDHQCILVELSGPGIDFVNNSVSLNFDVKPLGNTGTLAAAAPASGDDRESAFERFSRDAQINVKGLSTSNAARDVYLYVETLNMPKDEEPGGGSDRKAQIHDQLLGRPGGGEPTSVAEIQEYLPTYRVHVWHDTGRTFRRNGKTVHVVEPQDSFGYAFVKGTDSYGWDHQLRGQGLQRIAPNFYKASVRPDNPLTVATKIATWNKPRPWWWELWEFLMDLWDDVTGPLRNPHHGA